MIDLNAQKCDGKRPCTTCVKANRPSECEFRVIDVPPSLPNHPEFVFWNEPDSSASRGASPREHWVTAESSTKPQITTVQPAPKIVPSEFSHIQTLSHNGTSLDQSQPPTLEQVHHPHPVILPAFSRLLSRVPPRILPEPHLMLLSLGAERFQLSDTAMGELDMKLYVPRRVLARDGLTFFCQPDKCIMPVEQNGNSLYL